MNFNKNSLEEKFDNLNTSPEKDLHIFREVLRPILGYWVVTWGCVIAGGMLSAGLDKTVFDWSAISSEIWTIFLNIWQFELLIFPFYFLYALLYRNPSNNNSLILKYYYISYWIITLFLLSIVLINGLINLPSSNIIDKLYDIDFYIIIIYLLSVIPFHAWGYWIWQKISKDKESDIPYYFRNRTFFPALITSGISFTFGWSIITDIEILSIIIPLSSLVIVSLLFIASIKDSQKPALLYKFGVFIFLFLFVNALFYNTLNQNDEYQIASTISAVLFFALILTMFLGVFEASCVTVRVITNEQLVSPTKIINSPKSIRLYIDGINGAISYLFPLFLTTALHPAVNIFYILGIFSVILLFYWIWICTDNLNYSKITYCFIGRLLGFVVLLLLVVGASFKPSISSNYVPPFFIYGFISEITPYALLVISVRLTVYFEKDYKTLGILLLKKPKLIDYSNKLECISLTVVITGILSVITFMLWLILKTTNKSAEIALSDFSLDFTNRAILVLALFVFYQALAWLGEKRLLAHSKILGK